MRIARRVPLTRLRKPLSASVVICWITAKTVKYNACQSSRTAKKALMHHRPEPIISGTEISRDHRLS